MIAVGSWLTEDDMSEDVYTPYESEGEDSLASLDSSGLEGEANKETGGERVDEGSRRRSDFNKDLRDSPRARSLSRERGWYEGSGKTPPTNPHLVTEWAYH
jgi:hypothetical protein